MDKANKGERYFIDVADMSFGEFRLIHREVSTGYSEAEDRFNEVCSEAFVGLYGDPEHMEVILSKVATTAPHTSEAILAMDMADFRFFAEA